MSKRSQISLITITIALITLPYLFAMINSGEEYVFNGFLLNPIDGNSYLAKMRLGWTGEWKFTLPFAAEQTQGGYLFLFYIFLGQLARWLGISLLATFHLARISGALVLCIVLARFIRVYLPALNARSQTITFGLVLLGSGLGWLAAFFGGFTSDFWVAEAYPFLSMYSNPHFSIGLALVVSYFVLLKSPRFTGKWYLLLIAGLSLAIIMPFGVVLAGIVTVGVQVWDLRKHVFPIRWWSLLFLIPGGLFLIYQYAITYSDPLLVKWNAQNLTITAPIWDILISFSPALIAALAAVWVIHRSGNLYEYRLLIIWLAAGLILAYFPFQLQRRFLLGYYIPVVCLAMVFLGRMLMRSSKVYRSGVISFIAVSVLTNVFILAGGLGAITSHNLKVYYPRSMQAAFDWMISETSEKPLILASSETGLLIPGATGWRVIYGHPYETPDASFHEQQVMAVYRGELSPVELGQFIEEYDIDYLYLGPFEQKYGASDELFSEYPIVYSNHEVLIFSSGAGE